MKANLWKLTVGMGCLLVAGRSTMAGPLQRGDLPVDPAWVLHFDSDLLRSTTIGQFLHGELNKPQIQAKLAAFQALFSFDLQKQLHGVTLYGTGSTPELGILIVYGDFDAERLLTLAKAAKDYRTADHNQHVIHSWIDQMKKTRSGNHPRVYAALLGNRLIFGQREATVAAALDVIDGAAPSLASTQNFPQLGVPGSTSAIQAAAHKLDLPDADPNAALFRLSKMVRLEIGESQSQMTMTVTLEANDENVAQHMATIGQGLVALMKLQNKPEAARIADAITIKQEGATMVSTLSLPAGEVVAMMKAGAARRAANQESK